MIKILFFLLCVCLVFTAYGQKSTIDTQHISQEELKQRIFSAGRCESVHIDLISPAERKESGQISVNKNVSSVYDDVSEIPRGTHKIRNKKLVLKTKKKVPDKML